jgi:hypothetical protein
VTAKSKEIFANWQRLREERHSPPQGAAGDGRASLQFGREKVGTKSNTIAAFYAVPDGFPQIRPMVEPVKAALRPFTGARQAQVNTTKWWRA